MASERGSEKLLAAWRSRALTDDAVEEIGATLAESPGTIETVQVHGGAQATGISMSIRYDGDDVPWCGNDVLFWLKWHLRHGGVLTPPKIIINGIPFPEELLMELVFGVVPTVAGPGPQEAGGFGQFR